MSNSVQPHRLQPTRLCCPWDSPGKNTGVGCHFLLQGIFPTQGSNPGLPHCRQMVTLSQSWTIKKTESWRIENFVLWCWRRLLRVPWSAKRSNQSILKKLTLNIDWKNWCWSQISNIFLAMWCKEMTHWKRLWCWERSKAKGKGGSRGWND